MKKQTKYTKFDNYRLYLRLKKAGDLGDVKAFHLAKKMEFKFKTKAFLEEFEIYQSLELSKKARSGNLRAIVKLQKIREIFEKERRIAAIKSRI